MIYYFVEYIPKNYFLDDNPKNEPVVRWRESGDRLYLNWLKNFVVSR
ncbi:MAG: homoserine O-succinyltransferase [Candidatus Woesearchaeota archaeon]|nr:homoserine O-succinyltransferase [Candidatus Woesearchaeota archaeon]